MMKKNYKLTLLNIYLFLFIFTMINREFLFWGVDLRFVLLPLGIILLIYGVLKREYKSSKINSSWKLICLFYIWIFISNISWLWNGFEINSIKFLNEMILIINVFVSILNIWIYKSMIKSEYINKCIIFSCLVLVLSMILVSCGFTAKQISASPDQPYKYTSTEIDSGHRNIYGWNFRPAGYASDPNYATMLLLFGLIATLKSKYKKISKIIFLIVFLMAIGMSFSKTLVLACCFGFLYLLFVRIMKKHPSIIKATNVLLILGIVISALAVPKISWIKSYMPYTMKTRFVMWNSANELFEKSPIIGSGITSFRSYFSEKQWYVQSHNTYWQVLSELGIIGILILCFIFYKLLNDRKNNPLNFFITVVFLIFMFDFETIALQFIVYILCLCSLEEKSQKKGKKALFMINSLSNGGAERVCINMANELITRNYAVDFILLGCNQENKLSYEINPSIHIYDLKINEKNKLKKIIQILQAIPKVNSIISENEKEEQYELITSHLPMSNILTRVSCVKDRAIYVFHSNISHYGSKKNILFKIGLHCIYGNKKIVTVSEGVRQESIKDYKMNKKYIKTIYNPILLEEIQKKENETIDLENKYILLVGRFSKQKRQDRMIDIFYQGKFYENYKLVFCGTGELEEEMKQKVHQLNIQNHVIFLGWQSNIYKWMKNASLLVCTSDNEAFPMTLIEAIGCNTRIVSSNCKFGPDEILLDEYSQFLVETDNMNQYIQKMQQALESYPTAQWSIIEKCKASNVIDSYLKFMNEEL